ncbi:MAG: tetraacyldisaccharide 4'-kinase [Herminiimonas sp.]|nr:tetraacyldisaccharide 4'-kinase [Herminiimonas sp.]
MCWKQRALLALTGLPSPPRPVARSSRGGGVTVSGIASTALNRAPLEAFFLRTWMHRGAAACLLWPLSLLFGLVAAARRGAYRFGLCRQQRLPVPVVVVGNLFVGGTGKTPLTIWLVETLRQAGHRPGVISRGHGRNKAHVQEVLSHSPVGEIGDEPVLIAQRTACPLVVGRDRVAAGRALLAAHPDITVIIADDGLQHYRLARDIEIVLSDARGAGNGWLLPAGPLREPVSRRRDFSVENVGTPTAGSAAPALAKEIIAMQLLAPVAEQLRDRSTRMTLAALAATDPAPRILAAAGIGNPARFFATLTAVGLVFDALPLPDHHVYTAQTFADCTAECILITEKDAVKCSEIAALATDPRIWVVPVSAVLAASFAEKILEKLRGFPTA